MLIATALGGSWSPRSRWPGLRALQWSKSKQKLTYSQIFFARSFGFTLLFPLPVGAEGGSHLFPGLPFLFWVLLDMFFCLMGRVSFLFLVPWAYLITSSLSCKLCYWCGICLCTFPCLSSATTRILTYYSRCSHTYFKHT